MSNEEKILQMLGQMQGQLSGLDGRMGSLEAGQTEMKADIDSIKAHMVQMDERLEHVDERLEHVDERTRHTGVLVESTLVPNVQLLFEGHVTILHQMETLPAVVQLQEDVGTLRVAVKILGDDVAVLKKAI